MIGEFYEQTVIERGGEYQISKPPKTSVEEFVTSGVEFAINVINLSVCLSVDMLVFNDL